MNEFQTQLAELFDLQRALDQRILGDKPYPLQQMIIAFIAEVGELLKEYESLYKHWKKNPTDNRQRMLEEYVDCMHFALSILIYRSEGENYFRLSYDFESFDVFIDWDESQIGVHLANIIYDIVYDTLRSIISLLALGNMLQLTWPEIYEEYKRKNAINHQRQEEGY